MYIYSSEPAVLRIKLVKTLYQAHNANAFAERWIRSLREECLNHLIIFGLDRLQYVLDQYKDYFNQHRPHQGIGNRIPARIGRDMEGGQTILDKSNGAGSVQCKQFLGGLLKSYSQKAA